MHRSVFVQMCRLCIVALCTSCTLEWNNQAPVLALTGPEPSLDSLGHINTLPAQNPFLMTGPDGAPWAAFCEYRSTSPLAMRGSCARTHLVRLDGKPGDEVIEADGFSTHPDMLYETVANPTDATQMTLTMHRPGDRSDASFTLPSGRALQYANDDGASDVFVYWLRLATTTSFDIYRFDQKHHRTLPIPAGVDPANPDRTMGFDFLLTKDGSRFVMVTPDGVMTAYSTLDETSVALGMRPSVFTIDNTRHAALTVGADGLVSVPLDGSPARVLTTAVIDPRTVALWGSDAWYATSDGVWRVPLDGSAPATLITPGAARFLTLAADGTPVTSTEPRVTFVNGAGDGWWHGQQFMQRGLLPSFTLDGKRLHFLEHAATLGAYGDLFSVNVNALDTPRTLAQNARTFAELPDGRVLAIENRVYQGSWNRLVVIDEDADTKRWVVPSATNFLITPDLTTIVATVVTGGSGFDIVRLPVPSR